MCEFSLQTKTHGVARAFDAGDSDDCYWRLVHENGCSICSIPVLLFGIGDQWQRIMKWVVISGLCLGNRACRLHGGYWDTLQWRHNGRDGVSNHQPHDCLLKRLFRRRSKLRVTGLCAGNSPVTGEVPAQRSSNTEMFPFDDVIMNYPVCSHGKPLQLD